MAEENRSLAQRVLDVAVFAPAGLLLTVAEDMPSLAEKGRNQIEERLRNARIVGQFVVNTGQRELRRRLGRDGESGPSTTASAPEPSPGPVSEPTPVPAEPIVVPAEPTLAPVATLPAEPAPEPETALAIPDYDNLSASQVVRRLDGLAPSELRAVARHETATRGRRTILHRVQQLLVEPGEAS